MRRAQTSVGTDLGDTAYKPPSTAFARLLRDAVHATPGAIGAAFAARDGEMVDWYGQADDAFRMAVLTAHIGVIVAHVESAFGTLHFGAPREIFLEHEHLTILVSPVADGYFALLAMVPPVALQRARTMMRVAVARLRREMG